jgi:hypothetical protein
MTNIRKFERLRLSGKTSIFFSPEKIDSSVLLICTNAGKSMMFIPE